MHMSTKTVKLSSVTSANRGFMFSTSTYERTKGQIISGGFDESGSCSGKGTESLPRIISLAEAFVRVSNKKRTNALSPLFYPSCIHKYAYMIPTVAGWRGVVENARIKPSRD